MRVLFTILLICSFVGNISGQTYAISGYIVDKETGETVIGASVVWKEQYKGCITDLNGFYHLTGLPPGKHEIEISHISYETRKKEITITDKGLVLPDIAIQPKSIELEEVSIVEIKPEDFGNARMDVSHMKIQPSLIQSIPTADKDVFKAIKFLPGIEEGSQFSPLYSARGGDPSENMVLLDGVTIYNPYHSLTGQGLFNLYAIKEVDLLVGGFGAEFGGRNSSIMNITTKEGNNKKLHGEVSPSLMYSTLALDFPAGNNSTMMVSGRTFYSLPNIFLFYSPAVYYDFNLSFTSKLNDRNRLTLKYFRSEDYYDYKMSRWYKYLPNTVSGLEDFDEFEFIIKNKWTNQAATAILKTIISPRVYLRTQISGSFFNSNDITGIELEGEFESDEGEIERIMLSYNTDLKNRIEDLSAKTVLNVKLTNKNTVRFGGEYSHYLFSNSLTINELNHENATRNPDQVAGFTEYLLELRPFQARLGSRFTQYSFSDELQVEPRAGLSYIFPGDLKIKAAWGIYQQNIISINSPEYMLVQFLDYYYPLQDNPPSTSIHYILGAERPIGNFSRLSMDLYYKDIIRTYTFDIGLNASEVVTFTDRIMQGTGKACGMELQWLINYTRLSGMVSYALSRSTRSFDHIMNGKEFLYDYDRTHSFKTILNYQATPRINYSTTFEFKSGVPRTIETGSRSYFYYDPVYNVTGMYPTGITTIKNNARLPFYIRLDLGLKKEIRNGFAAELVEFLNAESSYLNFSIENIMFLWRNVEWYFPMPDKYLPFGTNYIPYVNAGYTIKF
ncbi:MAG: TonB-dependent receptor [Bacteroidales bacterium]|nr:TonB-dependent receptor [Bacteroidales bacterium]